MEYLSRQRVAGTELPPRDRPTPKLLDEVVVFEGRVFVLDNDPRCLAAVRKTLSGQRSNLKVRSAAGLQVVRNHGRRVANDKGGRFRRLSDRFDRLADAVVVGFLRERLARGGNPLADGVTKQRVEGRR